MEEFTLICKSGRLDPSPDFATTSRMTLLTINYSLGCISLIYKIKGCCCTITVALKLYDTAESYLHNATIALIPLHKLGTLSLWKNMTALSCFIKFKWHKTKQNHNHEHSHPLRTKLWASKGADHGLASPLIVISFFVHPVICPWAVWDTQ